jgi:hypothetical protein
MGLVFWQLGNTRAIDLRISDKPWGIQIKFKVPAKDGFASRQAETFDFLIYYDS